MIKHHLLHWFSRDQDSLNYVDKLTNKDITAIKSFEVGAKMASRPKLKKAITPQPEVVES